MILEFVVLKQSLLLSWELRPQVCMTFHRFLVQVHRPKVQTLLCCRRRVFFLSLPSKYCEGAMTERKLGAEFFLDHPMSAWLPRQVLGGGALAGTLRERPAIPCLVQADYLHQQPVLLRRCFCRRSRHHVLALCSCNSCDHPRLVPNASIILFLNTTSYSASGDFLPDIHFSVIMLTQILLKSAFLQSEI